MRLFAGNKNYGEVVIPINKNNVTAPDVKDIPNIKECPNGDYEGYRYGYTFETIDGKKYRTKEGIYRSSRATAIKHKGTYRVKDGVISEAKSFSGMAEVGAGLQGASYGKVKNPNDTKIRIDYDGFKIPKDINKSFSMENNKGRFTGNMGNPSVTISKDNTIMRGKDSNTSGANGNDPYNQSTQPNEMSNYSLEWNKEKTFHLAVEPWVTAPLVSDSDDGIYIGTIKGDKLDTGKKVLTLAIKINVDNPESIICLIKNQKAFLFKKDQMVSGSGSKLFSDNEETEFIKHKPDGSWGIISKKTGDFWPQNYKSKDSALSALRGYQANKHYSEYKLFADPNQQATQQAAQDQSQGQSDQGQDQSQQDQQQPPQQPTVNRSKKGEELDKKKEEEDQKKAEEEQSQDQTQPQPTDQPEFKETKVAPSDSDGINYNFKFELSEPEFEMDSIIGTLLFSVSFGHILHLVNSEYSVHMAMDEYYKKMPELVDQLAENYLATTPTAEFKICIAPESIDPVPYLEKLQEYVSKFEQDKLSDAPKFSSLIDDVLKQIGSTLYKLKRLNSGRKIFSFNGNSNAYFSVQGGSALANWRDTINSAIETYVRKFKKSPIKEIKSTDGRTIKQYVKNNVVDDESALTIMKSLVDNLSGSIAQGFTAVTQK